MSKRDFGSIFERNGLYYVRVRIDGRRIDRAAGPSRAVASKRLAALHVAIAGGTAPSVALAAVFGGGESRATTLADAARQFIDASRQLRPSTRATYEVYLRILSRRPVASKPIASVTVADADAYARNRCSDLVSRDREGDEYVDPRSLPVEDADALGRLYDAVRVVGLRETAAAAGVGRATLHEWMCGGWVRARRAVLARAVARASALDARVSRMAAEPERVSGVSVNHEIAFAQTVTAWAIERGLASDNPWAKVERFPAPDPTEYEHLSAEELATIIGRLAEPYRTVAHFDAVVPLRLSALLSLKRRDLNMETGVLSVRIDNDKARYARGYTVPAALLDEVRAHLATRTSLRMDGSDPLFADHDGLPLKRDTVYRNFKAAARATLPPERAERVTFHTIRHSAATRAFQSEASAAEVMYLLGHRSLATTKRYTHLQRGHADGLLGRLADGLAVAGAPAAPAAGRQAAGGAS